MKCLSVFAASNGAIFEPEHFIIYGSGSSLSLGQILFPSVLYSLLYIHIHKKSGQEVPFNLYRHYPSNRGQ